MVPLAKISSTELNRLCGQCHESQVEEKEKPTVIAGTGERPVSASLVRSLCFTRSSGALRCTTCHQPHQRVSTDRPAYDRICLSCHRREEGEVPCPVQPARECTTCHMPAQKIEGNSYFRPPTHWIRVYRKPGQEP